MTQMTILQSTDAAENDQEISVYALTVDGKKALTTAVRDMASIASRHSERQTEDAKAFYADISGEQAELVALTSRVKQLGREIEGSAASDTAKLDEFFELEAQVEAVAGRVFNKEGRIASIIADLTDPVASLANLEMKYPTLRRHYLEALGR